MCPMGLLQRWRDGLVCVVEEGRKSLARNEGRMRMRGAIYQGFELEYVYRCASLAEEKENLSGLLLLQRIKVMGCFWSKSGLPTLSSRSRVIDDQIPVKAFSSKAVIDLTHIILAREIPEKKSVRFAQQSTVYEDAALDLLGYVTFKSLDVDGIDEDEFRMPSDLHKKFEDISAAQLRRMIATIILPQNGKPKAPSLSVKTSAADAPSGSGSTPEDGEDCCMDHLLPVLDHDMLWALLSTRPGWERDLLKYRGRRKPSSDNSFIEYRVWIRKTRKQFKLANYCLPWPDMYAASTDYLISFVKMVNLWAGSEVFELRRISNDPAKRLEDNVVNFPRVASTPDRPVPENDMFRDGSCAASGDSMRTTMERNSRRGFVSSVFSNDSTAFLELDPTTGRSRRAAEGHPLPTPAKSRRSYENRSSEVSEQASAWPAHMFTTDQCGPGAQSAKIHSSEMLEQTWTVPPNMFQNVPKPCLGPPPMIDFSGQKKQESLEDLSTTGLVQGTPGYGTLLTSDSVRLRVAQTRSGFDAAVAQGRRPHIVTFASPYQSPPRATTQKYSGSKSSSFP